MRISCWRTDRRGAAATLCGANACLATTPPQPELCYSQTSAPKACSVTPPARWIVPCVRAPDTLPNAPDSSSISVSSSCPRIISEVPVPLDRPIRSERPSLPPRSAGLCARFFASRLSQGPARPAPWSTGLQGSATSSGFLRP
ncbi:hypothetical protein HJG60_009790 [Phyllostomus discolor]|uniref:Uncharacterized protein n=1 Tax=Phyllostomus discolor TaxID=89673 RepID=A0A834EQE3_9CHIR|nr:hypothetical protein HJG60_009790 [Phyllostomus discolor]